MCSQAGISFGKKYLSRQEAHGKRILEVGAKNFNGSWRFFVEKFHPKTYIGTDMQSGKDVDVVCNAEDLVNHFGQEQFDIVISTELLEHAVNWQKVISNIKKVLKPNGLLFITTRSQGYGYHGYPYDFWRYEIIDMRLIFSDFKIKVLLPDPVSPGVFLKAQRKRHFDEKNLSRYKLYSILTHRRCLSVNIWDITFAHIWYGLRRGIWKRLPQYLQKAYERSF